MITTKKGSKGRTQVTYDGYVSAASAAKLHDLLGAKDFVTIANEKYENWGMKGQAVYDPNGPDTNWNDYIFRTGFSTIITYPPVEVRIKANIMYH